MASRSLPRSVPLPVPSERALAVLALATATGIWGTSFVAAKAVLDTVPPITLAFLRFAIAVAVLLPLLRRRGIRPDWGREAALLGLPGVALLFLCQNLGLRLTSATNATLILDGGLPVLTLLLAAVVLGERLGRRGLVGAVASVVGVAAIVFVGGGNAGSGSAPTLSALGDGLIFVSAACGAVHVVLGRRAFARGGEAMLATTAGSIAYGALFLLPAAAGEAAVVGLTLPSTSELLVLLYLGAGASALAFVLWGHALRHLPAGESALIGNAQVPVGVAAAVLFLGESLTLGCLLGGALVLVGAWLATSGGPGNSRRHPINFPRPRRRRRDRGAAPHARSSARYPSSTRPAAQST